EQLRTRPDVGGVRRDKDRQVADQANPSVVGVALQVRPLSKEQELTELVQTEESPMVLPYPFEVRWVSSLQFPGPVVPGTVIMQALEDHEQGEIVEPAGLGGTERIEGCTQPRAGSCLKVLPSAHDDSVLERARLIVGDVVRG